MTASRFFKNKLQHCKAVELIFATIFTHTKVFIIIIITFQHVHDKNIAISWIVLLSAVEKHKILLQELIPCRYPSCSSSCSCWGDLFKKPKASSFQIDQGEIWQECSSKYASIDEVGFSNWRHTFKMASMTSFHPTKCCHLVSEEVSACAYTAASVSSWSTCTFLLVTNLQ